MTGGLGTPAGNSAPRNYPLFSHKRPPTDSGLQGRKPLISTTHVAPPGQPKLGTGPPFKIMGDDTDTNWDQKIIQKSKALPSTLRRLHSSLAPLFLRPLPSAPQHCVRNPQPSPPTTTHFSTSTPSSENPNDVYTSPYKAKRLWPPDMSKLSSKQQFRLERKYRRRAKLKWARPTWKKWTKLVQWTSIGFVLIYSDFFMELKDGGVNPFIREFGYILFVRSRRTSVFMTVFRVLIPRTGELQ
ncbi:predicted protein [Uncinocarpus reesii 1704]|uniref:Uncharacterized protein n=1 Tax=Uncinocarpus reesii (strain UAMH 1704) TaxID=336963 RepID=C4JS53_UNCRE|nr:uncharacterized protein UREG_05292 [Uncinocarpus reesii 1704]EEP80450.1 predicted protein [Uncinocarpus reesii 1704]